MNFIRTNLRFTGFLMLVIILGTGCKKFLEQERPDSLTQNEFFKTKEDANAAITGLYDQLQECAGKFLVWGESRADLVSPINRKNDYTLPYELTYQTDMWALRWGDVYQIIGAANVVIDRVPPITKLDSRLTQKDCDAIVGEAYFLRALAYFYLTRTFGEVPLVLEAPLNDQVNFQIPKSTAAQILAKIEADLAIAEVGLPEKYDIAQQTRGRATKAAANALQADVYLWQAKYVQAAAAAKKVIDNTALYELVPGTNWFDIFALKNSKESIFEIQYDYIIKETNSLADVSGQFLVNNTLYPLYEDTNNPDKVRGLDATYNNGTNGRTFWKYVGLNTTDVRRPGADANFIIYRLADVILMRAEALAHLEEIDKEEAITLINIIRTRANLPLYDINLIGTDANSLVDLIFKERALEFAMEGKRWFDLVRVGINGRPQLLIEKIVASRLVAERAITRARVADPRSWYLPIHRDELAANHVLVQNPYYR